METSSVNANWKWQFSFSLRLHTLDWKHKMLLCTTAIRFCWQHANQGHNLYFCNFLVTYSTFTDTYHYVTYSCFQFGLYHLSCRYLSCRYHVVVALNVLRSISLALFWFFPTLVLMILKVVPTTDMTDIEIDMYFLSYSWF